MEMMIYLSILQIIGYGDGTGNNADTDDDGDSVLDRNAFPLDETESVDTDGDGVRRYADTIDAFRPRFN